MLSATLLSQPPRTATARLTEEESEAGACDCPGSPAGAGAQTARAPGSEFSGLAHPSTFRPAASVVLTGSRYLPDTRALETTGFFSPSPAFARVVGPNVTSHHGIQDFALSPANFTSQVKTRSIHPRPRSCRVRARLACGQPPPVARPARTQHRDAPSFARLSAPCAPLSPLRPVGGSGQPQTGLGFCSQPRGCFWLLVSKKYIL